MEFSFNRPGSQGMGAQTASSGQTGGADERLKKAIERNRQKQLKKQAMGGAPQSMGQSTSIPGSDKAALMEKLKQKKAEQQARMQAGAGATAAGRPRPAPSRQAPPPPPMGSPTGQKATKAQGPSFAERLKAKRAAKAEARAQDPEIMADTPRPTRRTVAKNDDQELLGNLRKQARGEAKAPATINYAEQLPAARPKAKAKRKVKTKKDSKLTLQQRFNGLVVKCGWAFCLFLLGRLIFSDGGVMDFYASKTLLNDKFEELERVRVENVGLQKEIEMIRSDKSYQKKLVRDNLGFIAKDEFLILFPTSKK